MAGKADRTRALLDDQITYYRQRAAEYDATSTPEGDPYAGDLEAIRASLASHVRGRRVLELACGTGQWTGFLAEQAEELLAVDAAPEMLALNAAKHPGRDIRYALGDAFDLALDGRFDVIFFGFWLSHVPMARFDHFWARVRSWLADGGRVALVDEADHGFWEERRTVESGTDEAIRQLNDGSVHRIVKVLWQPTELEGRLRGLGWDASVTARGPFYWARATRHIGR